MQANASRTPCLRSSMRERSQRTWESACKRAKNGAISLNFVSIVSSRKIYQRQFLKLSSISASIILTFRPSEQGGYRKLTRDERVSFWKTQSAQGHTVWWDLEPTWPMIFHPIGRTIISHHDFSGVPADLEDIYERLAQTPARVVKIAVQANEIVDCIPVFQLLDRARNEGREVIAIAMGNSGIATRILGPSRGSFLTHGGSLDDDSATAPGQVNARTLRSLYNIDSRTKKR